MNGCAASMRAALCIAGFVLLASNSIGAIDEISAAHSHYTFDPDLGLSIGVDAGGFRGIYDTAGVRKTYHPLNGGGQPWEVVTTATEIPYLGNKAWYASVDPALATVTENGRTENIVVRSIRFGDTIYVRFAFKALDADSLTTSGSENWVFLAQLWQSNAGTPPVFLAVKPNGSLELVKRDFRNDDPNDLDNERTTLWESADDGWYMQAGQWYHFHMTLKPGRNNDGIIRLMVMDHHTGLWDAVYSGNNIDDVGKAYPAGTNPEFKFKLGGYMGRNHWWSALYDSIDYAKTWNRSLRHGLIGSARKILDLGWNSIDQSARGNNFTLQNGAYWSGTWLYLDGSDDFASMNVASSASGGLADFDVGNQLRIETHFRLAGALSGTAGVFYAPAASGGEGYGITVRETLDRISFVVGHPDGTATWVHHFVSVKLNTSYEVVATYDRFGEATFELFEGGVSLGVVTQAHAGKPIATPTQVWLGKRKIFNFNGSIDTIRVYNNVAGGI